MSSVNNVRIASAIGTIHPDQLQNLLADPRYTVAQVAAIAGTTPARLAQLLAEPVLSKRPRNWVSSAVVGTAYPYSGEWAGAIAQVYAGPSDPGFTYGPPAYDSDTPHPIASTND
jgi:hypothetical protein